MSAVAINSSVLTCYHAVSHVLRTHCDLDDADIHFATNYIATVYKDESDEFDFDQLILILTYADRSTICKFALTFNSKLDNAIKERNQLDLKYLLIGPPAMFVELYDNPYLSDSDYHHVARLIARHKSSMEMLVNYIQERVSYLVPTTCTSADEITQVINSRISAVKTECYDKVCITDGHILQEDDVQMEFSKQMHSESIYTVDIVDSQPEVFCFLVLDLIAAIASDTPVNPKTGKKFSQFTLHIVRRRFRKEIAMYNRFLDYISDYTK